MAVQKINVYFANVPLINNLENAFTLGYIDETNKLYPLPANSAGLNIVIIEPSDARLVDNSSIYMNARQATITLRFSITYQGYTELFSYAVCPNLPVVTQQDLYQRYLSLLPENVYSASVKANCYAEHNAAAEMAAYLYDNPNTAELGFYGYNQILENMFPTSEVFGWEYFLTGQNRLLYQSSTKYGELLQHIYQCEINNSNNPYFLAYNISKYIYLWLGKQRFVYIAENNTKLLNGFVLNLNVLGNRMLLGNSNYNGTVGFNVLTNNPDSTPPFTAEEQAQIKTWIRQLVRPSLKIEVDFTKSSADLGLSYIEDTYHGDPRQNNSYCIAFNYKILDQALGYTGEPIDSNVLQSLTSFSAVPANNATLNVGTEYTVAITTTPPWSGSMSIENYLQVYSNDDTIIRINYVGGEVKLTPQATGVVEIIYYLGLINYTYTYNII